MRRLLALLLLASAFVLGRSPDIAGACSCAEVPDPSGLAEWVDVVFTGTVTDARPEFPEDDLDDAIDRTIYTFTVDRVYEGEVAETVELISETESSACGASFGEGRHLVYAEAAGRSGQLSTGLCGGSRPLDDGGPGVPAELGDGVAPAAAPPAVDEDRGRPVAEEDEDGTEEAGPAATWPPIGGPDGDVEDASALDDLPVLAVGGGIVALVLAGVVLLVRRRRAA